MVDHYSQSQPAHSSTSAASLNTSTSRGRRIACPCGPRQASLDHEKHETHEKRDAGSERQVARAAEPNDCRLTFVCFVVFVVCPSVFRPCSLRVSSVAFHSTRRRKNAKRREGGRRDRRFGQALSHVECNPIPRVGAHVSCQPWLPDLPTQKPPFDCSHADAHERVSRAASIASSDSSPSHRPMIAAIPDRGPCGLRNLDTSSLACGGIGI